MGSHHTAATALCYSARDCTLAATAIPSKTLAFGLSTTDASFASLVWCVAAVSPP